MRKIGLVKYVLASLVAFSLLFGLAACNDGDETQAGASADADAVVDVYQDLQNAREAVVENLRWGDTVWSQIMLADDVQFPEIKYGLLVVPFFPSDLTARHTRTVDITGGNFTIQITSAETGIVWAIDQDGNITRVN